MLPRAINAALGFWLFLSVFLWPHSSIQRTNAWIVSLLVVTAALAGLAGVRRARYLNAVLGGWLAISALFYPRLTELTLWNHVIVGLALAFFGVAPNWRSIRDRHPVAP